MGRLPAVLALGGLAMLSACGLASPGEKGFSGGGGNDGGNSSSSSAPAAVLSASSTSVSFGNITVGTSTAQVVTVTNSGDADADISGIVISGSAFNTNSPSSTSLAPNHSMTISVNFAPTTPGAANGSLSVASNATDSSLQIALSGTGEQANEHSVVLNWQASASQVVGYFVYRGSGADNLAKLFTTADSSTSYTDKDVVGGQTYVYSVTSVDATNIESPQSSPITVTVPDN